MTKTIGRDGTLTTLYPLLEQRRPRGSKGGES